MSKSRFVFDKFAKLIEQGLINYKDVSDEVISILKSKRDEIDNPNPTLDLESDLLLSIL